jgi:hypothetical protein
MALDAIGSFGTAYGFANNTNGVFGNVRNDLFPDPDGALRNNFRVFVGLVREDGSDAEEESRSTRGNAPALAAWNAIGGFLDQVTPNGGSTAPKIGNGAAHGYAIEGRSGADYLSVVRTGNDGVCIHLVTGQSAGTGRQFMWTSDMGKACGGPWYAQASPISNDLEPYTPSCVWIDGNADEGHIWTGFNMHLGSFTSSSTDSVAEAWTENRYLLCKSEPQFSMYEKVEIGNQIRTFLSYPE